MTGNHTTGGIAKGLPLDDGDLWMRGTIVKAKGLGDATRNMLCVP
jgi:hypothetical protein